MRFLLTTAGVLIAAVGSVISYYLLINGKLSGGEFVAFTLGIIVVGIAVGFLPEVSELSIAGNVIKLRQAKEEAENIIDVLKESQKATFKFQLALSKRLPGGFGESGVPKDRRIDDFWFVYSAITQAKLEEALSKEIFEAADYIARGQVFTIQDLSDDVKTHIPSAYEVGDQLPSKSQMTIWAMDEESIEKSAKRHMKDRESMKLLVLESLEEYGRLLNIRSKYQS